MIAIILARGGSKRFPGKNLARFRGTPLIQKCVEEAIASEQFRRVIVSSDDPQILGAAASRGAEPLGRSPHNSSDSATSEEAMREVLQTTGELTQPEDETICLLQPTSPLRNQQHIRGAVSLLHQKRLASVISACALDWPFKKTFFQSESGESSPIFGWDSLDSHGLPAQKAFRPNGAIYLFSKNEFARNQRIYQPPMGLFLMSPLESIDVDYEFEITCAEAIASHLESK
jgi:CMP-N-acetylneuraminic acid synthetase